MLESAIVEVLEQRETRPETFPVYKSIDKDIVLELFGESVPDLELCTRSGLDVSGGCVRFMFFFFFIFILFGWGSIDQDLAVPADTWSNRKLMCRGDEKEAKATLSDGEVSKAKSGGVVSGDSDCGPRGWKLALDAAATALRRGLTCQLIKHAAAIRQRRK
jgi:hypothetical protein